MPFLNPHRARFTQDGITATITRCPRGSFMSLMIITRTSNGRLVRRKYTETPKREITTLYYPFFTDINLTPFQILSLDIHKAKYPYEILHEGGAGVMFPIIQDASSINGRRNCVLIKWTRV